MKIRVEIETNEPSPDIADLVSSVVEQAVKTHGCDNGDIRVETGDGEIRLGDLSMDNTLLTSFEATNARFEESDCTRGSMRYASEASELEYRLTFTLETTP